MPAAHKNIDPLDQDDSFLYFDDFFYYVDADMWTLTKDAAAAVADSDAHGGVLLFTTAATDNNEGYIATTQAVALLAADKPCTCQARLKFTEADTNAANVIFGWSSASGANSLLDNGGGPAASYSGAVFFKEDGQTAWAVESSNAGAQTTTRTNKTAGNGVYQKLKIDMQPISSAQASVMFWIDGYIAQDANGDAIKHSLALASLAAMKVIAGEKAGSGVDQAMYLDYIAFVGKR